MPLANLLLLIGLHLLVIQVLSGTFDIVEAELGVLLRFAGVVRQVADSPRSVWFAVLQPGEQLRRPLSRGNVEGWGVQSTAARRLHVTVKTISNISEQKKRGTISESSLNRSVSERGLLVAPRAQPRTKNTNASGK